MSNIDWAQLVEEHEIAYLRADICIGSPESYTLDEKRKICEDMEASTAEVDAAMRADFESLPDFARKRLLGHEQLSTTMRYLDVTGPQEVEALETLAGDAGPKTTKKWRREDGTLRGFCGLGGKR